MKHLKNLVVKLEDSLKFNELSNITIRLLNINLHLNKNKEKHYVLDLVKKMSIILNDFKKNKVDVSLIKYDTDSFIDDVVRYASSVRKDRWQEAEELILNLDNRNETIIGYINFVYGKYGIIPEINDFFKNLFINCDKISNIRSDTRAMYIITLYSGILGGPFDDLDDIFKTIYENFDETSFNYNNINNYIRTIVDKNLDYSSFSNVLPKFKNVLKKYPYLEKIILKSPKFTSYVMTEYFKINWNPGKEVLMKSNDGEAVYNYLFFSYKNDNQHRDSELEEKLFREFPRYAVSYALIIKILIPDQLLSENYDFSETHPITAIEYLNSLINKKGLFGSGEKLVGLLRTTYKTLFDVVIKNISKYIGNSDFFISFENLIKKITSPFPELEEVLIDFGNLYFMYDYLHYAITLYSEENNYDPEDKHSKLIKAIFDSPIGLKKIQDYFYLRSSKRSKIIEDYVFFKKLNNYKYNDNWIYTEIYINEFIKEDDFRKKYEKLLLDNYDKIVKDVDVNNVSSSDPLYQYYSIARNNKIEIPEKISKLFRR